MWHRIICYLTILGSAYLSSVNITSFLSDSEAETTREALKQSFEESPVFLSDAYAEASEELLFNDLEENLTYGSYKQHALFRIIGNILKLFGGLLLLRFRKLGFHLYIASIIFLVITGFTSLGTGPIGWSFNMLYLSAGFVFGLYFLYNYKNYT